jgi:ABC-type multidrug transport system, ATPase component
MIEVNGITKKYGKFVAVNDISLIAEDGMITVLLGPNGAGKSTTIKSIAGLLEYTGSILVNGHNNKSVEAKRSFGYIPESSQLYEALTIDEHIKFIARAYKIDDYEAYAEELLTRFHLLDKRKTIAKELSKGMAQKVSMILALVMKPQAILIDEPMVGLDPNAIEDVLVLLKDLRDSGVSVFISTHIIDVIDGIWDKAYIMNHGKIISEIRKDELKKKTLKEIFFEQVGAEE